MRLEGYSCGLIQEIQLNDSPVEGADGIIQIIRTGNFFHPWYGEFEITLSTLESMLRNYNNNVLKNDLMIDFNHEVKEAGAWVKKMAIKQYSDETFGLVADIKFTPRGKQAVKDEEYKFISADFTERYVDNETQIEYGPLLYGAAFTNRPFIKGMDKNIALSEIKQKNEEIYKMNLEEMKKQNEKLLSDVSSLQKRLEDFEKDQKKLSEENQSLKDENKKLSEDKVKSEKEQAFNKLLSEGKAVPAQKEAYMSGDMIKFAENFVQTNSKVDGSEDNKNENEADPEDKILSIANEKLEKKEADSFDSAMQLAIKENPELYKLSQEKFKK